MAKHREVVAPHVPPVLVSVPLLDAKESHLDNVFWVNTEYSFSKLWSLRGSCSKRSILLS
jgi:hypothetical protein